MSAFGPTASEYKNEPILSLDHHIFVLSEIKASLKKQLLVVNNEGTFVTITTPDQKEWKIFLKSNRDGKKAKKIEHLDICVVDESKIIGESQAAVVFGQNIRNNQTIAAKIQKCAEDKTVEEDIQNEREALTAASRLIGFGIFVNETNPSIKTFYTLMRYYPGINLLDFLYEIIKPADKTQSPVYVSKKEFDDITIAHFAIKALEELMLMYNDFGYMHRDIKTANFVVNNKGLKLIDLGAAKKIGTEVMQPVHSYGYLPSEQCPGQPARPWDFACDLWQTVIVIAEMLTKENYQTALQKNNELYASFDFIKSVMHDVFIPPVKKPETVREVLIDIIHKGTSTTLLDRPVVGFLPEMIKDLNTAILREQMSNVQNHRLRRTESSTAPEPTSSDKPGLRRKSILTMPKLSSSALVPVPPSVSVPVFTTKAEPEQKKAPEKKLVRPHEAPVEARPSRASSSVDNTPFNRQKSALFDQAKLRQTKEKLAEKKGLPISSDLVTAVLSESEVLLKLAKLHRNLKDMSQDNQSTDDIRRYTAVVTAIDVVEKKTLPIDTETRHNTLRMLQKYVEKNKQPAENIVSEMDQKMAELGNLLSKLKL